MYVVRVELGECIIDVTLAFRMRGGIEEYEIRTLS